MSRISRLVSLAVCLLLLVLALSGLVAGDDVGTRQDIILRVGMQDDMKTRNYLLTPDKWTSARLDPIYDTVGKFDPATEEPLPYILKGIDADDNGVFDLDEYGTYAKESLPHEVTAFYDLNGVYFHDGVQATMHDLLFSYHLRALCPLETSLDVLKDKNNLPGSNYSTTRWLNMWPVPDVWDVAVPVGSNTSLTFALHFSLQADFWAFVPQTLNGLVLVPRQLWEGTGRVCLDATDGVCKDWKENIHGNFRYAYNEATFNGRPISDPLSFKFSDAESWLMEDDEVIGTGPFEFGQWTPGVTVRIDKFEDYYGDALDCERVGDPPVCQGNFFLYMHQPYIDGMLFMIYQTPQMAVFALQAGEIDYVGWSIPPEFIGDLVADPNVELQITAGRGFAYLGYNMRMSPFGYPDNDPTQGDDGLYLRRAIAHVIDKNTIVTTLLQDFGVAGDQPVSPASVKWYNGSVAKYEHDLLRASQILDAHYTLSFQGGPGLGWSGGWRNLPTIGTQQVEILCPKADYDPILAQACNMIAMNMRAVGLNADANLVAFGQIVERLNYRETQMWLLESDIHTSPPDYYYSFFHSWNARAGLNYAGFNNMTFDDLIVASRAEMDPDAQPALIKRCSGVLSSNLPYDAIFFRTNIEAYRSDRFVNWTVGPAASIYHKSYWSWIGIHPPWPISINIIFPSGNTVYENEVLVFEVLVTVESGVHMNDAVVTISVSPSGPLIEPNSGRTVGGSIGPINFTAPEVETDTYFAVTASAESPWGTTDTIERQVKVIDVDTQPPEILDARAEPDPQDVGGYVNISAAVVDDKGLDYVVCLILDPDMKELENLTMEYNSSADRFYRERSYGEVGTYQYTIWAYDSWGNANWTTGTFEIVEPPLPWEYLALLSIVVILIVALVVALLLLKRRKPKEEESGETEE